MSKAGTAYTLGSLEGRTAIAWDTHIEIRGNEPGTGNQKTIFFWPSEALELAKIINFHFPQ